MPLYDYQCQDCQMVFEVRASFKEKEVGLEPECPRCKSKETRQLFTSGLFLRQTGEGASLTMPARGSNAEPDCCGG